MHSGNATYSQSCQSKVLPAALCEGPPRAQVCLTLTARPVQLEPHFSGFDSIQFLSWAELGDIPFGVQAQQVSR